MPVYRLAPGAEIVVFDSSLRGLRKQVICGEKRAAVSDKTAALLRFLEDPRSRDDLVGFCEREGIKEPETTLEHFLSIPSLMSFIQTVESGKEPLVTPGVDRRALPKGNFRLRFVIIPQALVNLISKPIAWLCATPAVVIGLLFIAVMHYLCYFRTSAHAPGFTHLNMPLVVFLVYLSVLIHELGHAAAAQRCGCTPGAIGAGIYFLWPVLYTDLTESWSLPRHLRAGIDLAGIYFQLIVSGIALLVGQFCLAPEMHVVTASILLASVINLNPFLKFDGYWLLTDIIGVPHLRLISTEALRHAAARLGCIGLLSRSKSASARMPVVKYMKPSMYLLLVCYGIVNVFVVAYWTFRIVRFSYYAVLATTAAFRASFLQLLSHPLSFSSLRSSFIILLAAAGSIEMVFIIGWRMGRLGSSLKERSAIWFRQ